ncbi:hypothetical protein ACNYDJ_20490 [Phocaeicola vulgatus]|uniref:hypothetical protein n=1 Tax=Phocaeicola vulgatus TaxID=821 RepID=UPI003AB530F5
MMQTAVDRAQPSVPWSGGRTAAQTAYLNFGWGKPDRKGRKYRKGIHIKGHWLARP